MKNLRVFENSADIRKYVLNNKIKEIGSGWEGKVYLTKDNSTLKIFKPKYKVVYSLDKLTTGDLNLDSFIFPDELFICDNNIYGYKARYFANNIFDIKEDREIDLEKLLDARRRTIEDIKVLTNHNYLLHDVLSNVLFDGDNLAFIDTLSYKKGNPTLNENIRILDDALDYQLMFIDLVTSALNIPFEEKIKRLVEKKQNSKMLIKGRI